MALIQETVGKVRGVARSLVDINAPGRNVIREQWDMLSKVPGGKRAFSLFVGRSARYTGSIGAQVVELRRGYARVDMPDRPKVRNHLKSVHAIALVNLAEMAGNLAVAYSLPDDARFIVAGLSIDYVKKARGTVTAECVPPTVATSAKQEYPVEVVMKDPAGEVVARCTLRTMIGPKKS